MSVLTLSAKLDRTDSNTSWGFRMQGGKDFGAPLTIQRVVPGSLAAKCGLQLGDSITRIGDVPTEGMRHKEAQQQILSSGNTLELALQRGGGSFRSSATSGVSYGGQPSYQPSAPSYQPSGGYGGGGPSAYNQNYNTKAKPFQGAPDFSMPVAVNKQYNTPIGMYSVDNVMDTLAGQTGALNIGGPASPRQDPVPPWRSDASPGGRPSAPGGRPAPAPMPSGGGSTWQPKVPTGPRKMRVGKAGEARNVASASGGRIPVCSHCHTTIRGPFISALDKSWCPDHFNCANPNCRVPLIGVGFVEEDGQLFCVRDYEQFFAPRCGKCGRSIIGEIVNALGDTYHMDCFTCCQCHCPIGAGSFHTEEGKIYCDKDWAAMFQTKCYGCQFPIEPGDRWVEALNQNWHSECFNCSTCQVNLEGQSFFAKGGRPYCKKHASGSKY